MQIVPTNGLSIIAFNEVTPFSIVQLHIGIQANYLLYRLYNSSVGWVERSETHLFQRNIEWCVTFHSTHSTAAEGKAVFAPDAEGNT